MLKMLLEHKGAHKFSHVLKLGWEGTQDIGLFQRAAEAGFEVLLTRDGNQMEWPRIVEAIAKSGLHRVEYPHKHPGLVGISVAAATVCAALPIVLEELGHVNGQRLVRLHGVDPRPSFRYTVRDPTADRPKFWPDTN